MTITAPGSRGPVRRKPGSGFDPRRADPANRAPPGSGSTCPAAGPEAGSVSTNPWHHDPDISWFGPHLVRQRHGVRPDADKALVGVAHRTLPCGTLVTFRYGGRTVTVPVVDRGPYVSGRTWDLTCGACAKLAHCFTGTIDWRFAGS